MFPDTGCDGFRRQHSFPPDSIIAASLDEKKFDFLAIFNQRFSLQLAVGGRAVHAEQGSTTTGDAVRGLCGEHSAVKKGPGLCVA